MTRPQMTKIGTRKTLISTKQKKFTSWCARSAPIVKSSRGWARRLMQSYSIISQSKIPGPEDVKHAPYPTRWCKVGNAYTRFKLSRQKSENRVLTAKNITHTWSSHLQEWELRRFPSIAHPPPCFHAPFGWSDELSFAAMAAQCKLPTTPSFAGC